MQRDINARLMWKIPVPAGCDYPRGTTFSSPARFDHQGDAWSNDAWSVVVTASSAVTAAGTQDVRVRFLMENGPDAWLTPGRQFSLFEGRLLLAEGVIESTAD